MGAAMIIGLKIVDSSSAGSSRPKTPGEVLDAALREQDERHKREIRDLEQKVASARRLAAMGGY